MTVSFSRSAEGRMKLRTRSEKDGKVILALSNFPHKLFSPQILASNTVRHESPPRHSVRRSIDVRSLCPRKSSSFRFCGRGEEMSGTELRALQPPLPNCGPG